jgi:hypothetical protein
MRRRGWFRRGRLTAEAAVVAEAEAILDGRALDAYLDRGQAIPPWLVANALAHAPLDRLRRMARVGPWQHPSTLSATLGRLATEVLAMGGDAEGVASVQRALLVPVELVLLDNIGLPQITVPELEVMLSALLSR